MIEDICFNDNDVQKYLNSFLKNLESVVTNSEYFTISKFKFIGKRKHSIRLILKKIGDLEYCFLYDYRNALFSKIDKLLLSYNGLSWSRNTYSNEKTIKMTVVNFFKFHYLEYLCHLAENYGRLCFHKNCNNHLSFQHMVRSNPLIKKELLAKLWLRKEIQFFCCYHYNKSRLIYSLKRLKAIDNKKKSLKISKLQANHIILDKFL